MGRFEQRVEGMGWKRGRAAQLLLIGAIECKHGTIGEERGLASSGARPGARHRLGRGLIGDLTIAVRDAA